MRAAPIVLAGSLFLAAWGSPGRAAERLPDGGGAAAGSRRGSCLTEDARREIARRLEAAAAVLDRLGLLPPPEKAPVRLAWPLKPAPTLRDPGYFGIANYVDQDPRAGVLLDYECGERTYDLPRGGHGGTDLFTWPFAWTKMDGDQVRVVAAAPGVILQKDDGQDDRSCVWAPALLWNAIYVRQADGTVAWYGHLKNGSQTRKPVGAAVRAGEQIGVVGSSGFSTSPHLHLELHGTAGELLDPFAGPCNGLNEASLWRTQSPYFVPSINRIATHSAAPELPGCPATYDVTHYQTSFARGDDIVFAIYLRDEQPDQVTTLSVIQPNRVVWQSWEHTGPRYYPASYWLWESTLPSSAPRGLWRFRVRTAGKTVEQRFTVH